MGNLFIDSAYARWDKGWRRRRRRVVCNYFAFRCFHSWLVRTEWVSDHISGPAIRNRQGCALLPDRYYLPDSIGLSTAGETVWNDFRCGFPRHFLFNFPPSVVNAAPSPLRSAAPLHSHSHLNWLHFTFYCIWCCIANYRARLLHFARLIRDSNWLNYLPSQVASANKSAGLPLSLMQVARGLNALTTLLNGPWHSKSTAKCSINSYEYLLPLLYTQIY